MNYLCKLSYSVVDCAVHILTGNGGTNYGKGGTAYSAVDGPRGDHLQCHGWSGGTAFGGDHL